VRPDGKIAGWDAPSEPGAIGAGVSRYPAEPGKVPGWDAPSDPDAIGAGVSRRPASPQQPLPPQMQRQLEQLHREHQPEPPQAQQQRLASYPPQPQFAPQGYQQPGPQGYQQPAPGQPYQAQGQGYQQTQFQGSAAAPPRPVAYTPNQQPVTPRPQPQQPPREREREREQPRPPVQKTVVKRSRGLPMGCLVKLAILALIGFGIYTGVNWAMAKINGIHHDLNNWVAHEWHQIAQKVHLEKIPKIPAIPNPSHLPTDLPTSFPGSAQTP
jgi:hypothetical protein